MAVVALVGGGVAGYFVADPSGKDEKIDQLEEEIEAAEEDVAAAEESAGEQADQAAEQAAEEAVAERERQEKEAARREARQKPIVLTGQTDQTFDKRTFSGTYKVTWSFVENSSPFLSVNAKKTANPDDYGTEVISAEVGEGETFVDLDGDYYIEVSVGGTDYKITFTPTG